MRVTAINVVLTAFSPDVSSDLAAADWGEKVGRAVGSWESLPGATVRVVVNQNLGLSKFSSGRVLEVELERQPMGALATALLGLDDSIASNIPLVISAGDTQVFQETLDEITRFIDSGNKAGILVFSSSDDSRGWSYAHLDQQSGDLIQVTEKTEPTNLKATGIFLFSNVEIFLKAAEWCFLNQISHEGAYFTSSAINYLLSQGEDVFVGVVSQAAFRKQRGVQ